MKFGTVGAVCFGPQWKSRRSDLDRRNHQQEIRQGRPLANHRRGNLRKQRDVRRILHRRRRILHTIRGRPRHLRYDAVQW